MNSPITTIYSSGFDAWYRNQYKLDRDKWIYTMGGKVVRLVVVGGKYCDPPVEDDITFEGPVVLKPEPENQYDPNAVAVYYGGRKIGYMVRERLHLLHNTAWKQIQDPEWKNLPQLVNSAYGVYAVGV